VTGEQPPTLKLRRAKEIRIRKPELSRDEQFRLLISSGSHLDWCLTNADIAPMAFCAVQAFADTALIAGKNLGIGSPNRSHPSYSSSFALVATAILRCGQWSVVSGQRFAGANFTAGGREFFANRPREAGDSVLVEIEWSASGSEEPTARREVRSQPPARKSLRLGERTEVGGQSAGGRE
jgi:hypothetical protein